MAEANEAYITTVYNNSYQYFNTAVISFDISITANFVPSINRIPYILFSFK